MPRGPYNKSSISARQRVIDAANNNEDFIVVAKNNGISQRTAYRLASKQSAEYSQRGGYRQAKINNEMENSLVQMLQQNPLTTLKGYKDMLQERFNVNVSVQAIGKHLDGKGYSMKSVHHEPETMNSVTNKQKRKEYAEAFMQGIAANQLFYYIDETNYNLFCQRSNGRSKRGERCVRRVAGSRGANLTIVGTVCNNKLIHWERRRAPMKWQNFNGYVQNLCQKILDDRESQPLPHQVINLVIDNAPSHSRVHLVVDEYEDINILRLGPYSPQLNIIENCWSVFKAHVKQELAHRQNDILHPSAHIALGITRVEYRLRILEAVADIAILSITPAICLAAYNHMHLFLGAAQRLEDINV